MTISDPAGLVARVPELEALADHAGLRRAIERGDVHGVYRRLWWMKITRQGRAHRETIDALLARRRLFVVPIDSAPTLMTYNGVGASAYGSDDRGDDGTFVLTHYLTVVFIPVFPIAQYLVAHGDNGGWRFFAKVPLATLAYLWNRAVALAIVSSVLVGVGSTWRASRYHDVTVVNGLDQPVSFHVGPHVTNVEAGGRVTLTVGVGKQPVDVRRGDGKSIETGTLDLSSGPDLVVWNVVGAAMVFKDVVVYGGGAGQAPESEVACGRSALRLGEVHHAFTEPPKSISMKKGSGPVHRSYVDVAPGGAPRCLAYLAERGDQGVAADLAVKLAEISDYDGDAVESAGALLVRGRGPEAAVEWTRKVATDRPHSLDAQRAYQNASIAAGRRASIVTEFAERRARDASSPDLVYLCARVAPREQAEPMVDEAVARFPEHVMLRRLHGYQRFRARRYADALASWAELERLAPKSALERLDLRVTSLAALGRASEALDAIDRAATGQPSLSLVTLYARVARLVPGAKPERLLEKRTSGAEEYLVTRVRAACALPLTDAQLAGINDVDERDAVAIGRDAADPDRFMKRVEKATPSTLRQLDVGTWALAYAEALRRAPEGAAAKKIAAECGRGPQIAAAIARFVRTGVADDELDDLDLETLAALELARSRTAALSQTERAATRKAAQRDAILPGAVKAAVDGWD